MTADLRFLASLGSKLSLALEEIGITATEKQFDQLMMYINELQKWNKTYNLTAIKDPQEMLIQHVFDSLAILPSFKRRGLIEKESQVKIIDVGSGAGLPGAILSIMWPEARVDCVDTVQKKIAFISNIAAKLDLPNLKGIHARIERCDQMNADIVISRAFASLSDFSRLAGVHVKANGHLVSMKSKQVQQDVAELQATVTDWTTEMIEPITVPQLDAQRYLVWLIRKTENAN